MILVETGNSSARDFEAKVQFARQLTARGHRAVISENAIPDEMNRSQKFAAIPFVTRISDAEIARVLIIGAETVSDELLENLRGYRFPSSVPVTAIARFESAQSKIGAQSKLAYALGYEPAMLDLSSLQPRPILERSALPLFAIGSRPKSVETDCVRLLLVLPEDLLEDPATLPHLDALGNQPGLDCSVVTAGFGKERIRTSPYSTIAAYGYAEFSPETLAGLADVVAVFGANVPGERMAALALDILRNAGLVIDCTETGVLSATGAPVIRGPVNLASLAPFLISAIQPNRITAGNEAAAHPWTRTSAFERIEEALGLKGQAPARPTRKADAKRRYLFVPTNGVGLGHAQRCSLVAAAMSPASRVGFAAFPTCIPLLQSAGFDCAPLVQKSDHHAEPFANDLINYLRLGRTVRPGDRLVFDGGYIFESIHRIILEHRLSAIWIRRGLWQSGQINQMPMDREKAFERVIVPAEAFDELNTDYSFGKHVRHVGPIVRKNGLTETERADLRRRLKKRFGHDFERLAITMLGGGAAADRSAQIQLLCALYKERPECLHLVLVWPNAKIAPGLYGWPNSHVVKSQQALALCQASDVVVAAAGYNTFHEVLYHRIPAIFIPQMAGYMDDQDRRARAASDRDLSVTVPPHELLTLRREIGAFLDGGKSDTLRRNLGATTLPGIGTDDAARLIEEVCPDGK